MRGDPVTDPAEPSQLDLTEGAADVTVPRELLANFGPKEPVHVPQPISFAEFGSMFTALQHATSATPGPQGCLAPRWAIRPGSAGNLPL
ncbi:hypothetical protein [Streptomyces sp. NPDC001153]